jgi:hypothetical protein
MRTIQTIATRVSRMAPSGRMLADDNWRRRHHTLLAILWLHAPGGGASADAGMALRRLADSTTAIPRGG